MEDILIEEIKRKLEVIITLCELESSKVINNNLQNEQWYLDWLDKLNVISVSN